MVGCHYTGVRMIISGRFRSRLAAHPIMTAAAAAAALALTIAILHRPQQQEQPLHQQCNRGSSSNSSTITWAETETTEAATRGQEH